MLIRNGNKKGAMTYKNLILLVLKMILDILSRILIFSAWMYTDNNGQFSTLRTLIFYYGLFLLLTAFNVVINRDDNWISKIISYVCLKSDTNFDFSTILKKQTAHKESEWKHESSLVKQTIYFIIIFLVNIG